MQSQNTFDGFQNVYVINYTYNAKRAYHFFFYSVSDFNTVIIRYTTKTLSPINNIIFYTMNRVRRTETVCWKYEMEKSYRDGGKRGR